MSEKYWLDKMKENPRYREIWEKIKEQPFNETTEIILDLEAKLAESERQANDWKQRFESSEERFKTFNSNGVTALNLKNEKIEKLKQQLAEKEKESSVLKAVIDKNKSGHFGAVHICNAISEFYEPLVKNLQNQTAIEKLEKVKEKFGYKHNSQLMVSSKGLYDYIDQQIKELKGENNENI